MNEHFDDPLDAAAPPAAAATDSALRWVAIRPLAPRHRPRILAHLLALPPRDRYLRFGYAASDSQVGRYIDQIDFDRDEVFGIFNRRLDVVAMAHLAYMGAADQPATAAEFGVSVAAHARGRGWGARLFDRAVLHARNRHVDTLLIHALADNRAMLHIVRQAGARVEMDGSDAVARLQLPREDFVSHLEAMVERQVAEWDYGLKLHAKRVDAWLHLLGDMPASLRLQPPGLRDKETVSLTQARDSLVPPQV
jgi:GNAT superfamily N-acetyltransferase